MALELGNVFVKKVKFGNDNVISKRGILTINEKAIVSVLKMYDPRIRDINVHLAQPGESTRIICVKDVLEPRYKFDGAPGQGRLHTMKNVAVVTCGQIVAYQEGIIDMSGPGAPYSPFSQTHNIVLDISVQDGLSQHEHEEVVRHAGLRALNFAGKPLAHVEPNELLTFDTAKPVDKKLPRLVYVYMLLSQGLMHDTYVWTGEFWRNAQKGLPAIADPEAVIDGLLHSGNCVSACDKNTTWHHQNNPVIFKELSEHGRTFNFVGVVLTNEPTRLAAKKTSAARAVELVKALNADCAIITEEGFGNPEADLMMIVRGLEQAGIKTVVITDEYAGSDGTSQSLADTTPEANAVVSVGNANELITLPPMKKIIGPIQDLTKLAGAYPQSLKEDGSLVIEIQGIVGATNQLGQSNLSCREV